MLFLNGSDAVLVSPDVGGELTLSMHRRLLPLTLAVGLLCSSCRTLVTPASPEYSDIAEALFRYLAQPAPVDDPDSHGVNLAHKVYFLQLDWREPDPSFLARLEDLLVPAEPLSAGVHTDFYWFDKKTGQRGAVFSIQNARFVGRTKAEAEADISPGGALRGSGSTYRLAKKAGTWVVVGKKLRWVS